VDTPGLRERVVETADAGRYAQGGLRIARPDFLEEPICSVLRRIVRGRENSTVSRTDSNVLKRAVRPG